MTATPTTPFVASANVRALRESMTIAVSQHAKRLRAAGRAIIDLGAGEPDFDTPAFVRAAAARAIDSGGASRYTAVEGIASLRTAIAERTSENAQGTRIAPEEVLVSGGSKQAIFNACFTLFGAGDEVLIPTPAWTSYYEIVELARARAVEVAGDPARGLTVTAESLARAATPNTRGVIINSPCNPTGAVYDDATLAEILALAEEREWWVIGDEIYRRLSYDAPASGLLDIARSRERLIVVDGVAKSYAMPGWRIGWSVASPTVTRAMAALQSHVTFHPAAVAQHAAVAALTERAESDAAVTAMVASYRERRDAAHALLERDGVPHVRPAGAFYLFIDVSAAALGAADAGSAFATAALEEEGVALVPGAAFHATDWVRLSYAAPVADVLEGVRRVAALYRRRVG